MKKTSAKTQKKKYPERAGDVPVTQKMLYAVRNELKSDILSFEHRFTAIDKKFEAIDHRFASLEHKIESLEHKMDAKLEKMSGEIHRMSLLIEEQNAKNNIVLDGLASLFHRQERCEDRHSNTEQLILKLIK